MIRMMALGTLLCYVVIVLMVLCMVACMFGCLRSRHGGRAGCCYVADSSGPPRDETGRKWRHEHLGMGKETIMDIKHSNGCGARNPQPPTSILSPREHEFVALGAALASNCVPCIEYHIREARKVGLTDAEITAAIELADYVRRVPAGKVFDVAFRLLAEPTDERSSNVSCTAGAAGTSCC